MKIAKVRRAFPTLLNVTIAAFALGVVTARGHAEVIEPDVLHKLTTGLNPLAALVQALDGNFYGTTQSGGGAGRGILFRMTPDGTVTTLVDFAGPNGHAPSIVPLISDDYGNLYGTTVHGGTGGRGIVFKVTLGGALTPLVHFDGHNGAVPLGLVMDNSGNLYGTTVTSAAETGSIFKIAPDGTFTTLFHFSRQTPPGMLIIGRDGHLYGRTYNGLDGLGTVYRFTLDGTFRTLARLSGCSYAYSTFLTEGNDGHLYGTTADGGNIGFGTAFRVTREGVITTLVHFDRTNGSFPSGPLTLGREGNLYGATTYGGVFFEGTVFKMTPAGALTTLAHFTARPSGVRPYGGVIIGTDGNLYGTTAVGGIFDRGTIFRVNLSVDTDGDGVPDNIDECADTPSGAIIDEHGCSLDQLVPCSGWRNHGQYLLAVAAQLTEFVSQGFLTSDEARDLFIAAAKSDCGKKHH